MQKKQLLILDKTLTFLLVLALFFIRPDYVATIAYVIIFPYLFFTKRTSLLKHLLVGTVMSIIFVAFIAKNEYGYTRNFSTILGINLFPLFAWPVGLFFAYLIYSHYEHLLKKHTFLKQFLLFIAFYWPMLIIAETIGYYSLEIHNATTAMYTGLPFCNCMHAPPWMQASYFLMGPIFFALCYLLKLENPHRKRKKK